MPTATFAKTAGPLAFGTSQVVRAPGGTLIAFGAIPFGPAGLGTSLLLPAILRPNPFTPAPITAPAGQDGRGPGWTGVFHNPNAWNVKEAASHPGMNPQGMPSSRLMGLLFSNPADQLHTWTGKPLYLLAGTQIPAANGVGASLVSYSSPGNLALGAGWPGGYYVFDPSSAPLGASPGTSLADQSDYAWAVAQNGPWVAANRGKIQQIDPLTFLSGSTLGSQVGTGTGAGSSSLLWIGAAALALYVGYEVLS